MAPYLPGGFHPTYDLQSSGHEPGVVSCLTTSGDQPCAEDYQQARLLIYRTGQYSTSMRKPSDARALRYGDVGKSLPARSISHVSNAF